MKSGYDQFFKAARKASQEGTPSRGGDTLRKSANATKTQPSNNTDLERVRKKVKEVRENSKRKSREKAKFPLRIIVTLICGLALGGWGYLNHQKLEVWLDKLEVNIGVAANAETPAKGEKSAETKEKPKEESSTDKNEGTDKKVSQDLSLDNEDLSYFNKLNERKNELDQRENELKKVEEELHKQRIELDKKIVELEGLREKIASILQERVQADDGKVEKLVQVYSDMKPEQAAKVIDSIDEGLAIEIIGRMKKKSAADILNLLKPEKAQLLSEKYAGYKR